jgi:hypothetical protein
MDRLWIGIILGVLALLAVPISAQANDCAVTYDPGTQTLKIPLL